MKALNFERFVFENNESLPPEAKLAKIGLSPGINVLEWWTDKDSASTSMLKVYFNERYNWPDSSEDDLMVEVHFDIQSSLCFVEKRMMRFAKQGDLDWVHDMERDTWKKVNR
jgi:hypothetical protein